MRIKGFLVIAAVRKRVVPSKVAEGIRAPTPTLVALRPRQADCCTAKIIAGCGLLRGGFPESDALHPAFARSAGKPLQCDVPGQSDPRPAASVGIDAVQIVA